MAAVTAALHPPSGGGDAMLADRSASISSDCPSSSTPSLLSRASTFSRTLARRAAVSVRHA